jgi:hypothetical protein
MTPIDFCYWMQGFFEIHDAMPQPQQQVGMTAAQVDIIRKHLALVFQNVTQGARYEPQICDDSAQRGADRLYCKMQDGAEVPATSMTREEFTQIIMEAMRQVPRMVDRGPRKLC